MSITAILAAWAATGPIRKKASESAGKFAKKTGGFFRNYWKEITLISGMVIVSLLAYQKGMKDGSDSADTAWLSKYNQTVSEFNARLKALTGDSTKVADKVNEASTGTAKDIDKINADLQKEADKQADAKPKPGAVAIQCTPSLNQEMPNEFWEAWKKMNEAGAANNPYK